MTKSVSATGGPMPDGDDENEDSDGENSKKLEDILNDNNVLIKTF